MSTISNIDHENEQGLSPYVIIHFYPMAPPLRRLLSRIATARKHGSYKRGVGHTTEKNYKSNSARKEYDGRCSIQNS